LDLLPGTLTPSLQEYVTRVGAKLPFAQVVEELRLTFRVVMSEPTVRRHTEAAGEAYVAVQTAEAAALERDAPPAPAGPAVQQMSVDGCMVPLVGKEWGEVRTVAIGVVGEPVERNGEWEVHSDQVSYFSRLCDAETFTRLAVVETHRRGTETAQTVVGVVDGAEWEQGFLDMHRPDAVRILDFPHAAGYVATVGQVVHGQGTEAAAAWLAEERHKLKHETPEAVLADLRCMQEGVQAGGKADAAGLAAIEDSIRYLDKRTAQMRYAQFQAAGYPIGSGMVESGNKVVVEARLKGAGMHWAGDHVNPMLALRTAVCSGRWEETWPAIYRQRRAMVQEQRTTRGCAGHRAGQTAADQLPKPGLSGTIRPRGLPAGRVGLGDSTTPGDGRDPRRPAPDHPWRHAPIGQARYRSPGQGCPPKP